MASVAIAVRLGLSTTLERVLQSLEQALGPLSASEHLSSNYPRGVYYAGHLSNVSLEISHLDEVDLPDFEYLVYFRADDMSTQTLNLFVDSLAINRLLPAGFVACKIADFGKTNSRRQDYAAPE